MEYISTRNNSDHFSFKNVFLKGLADDGGLFVPKSIKPLSLFNSSLLNGLIDFGTKRPPSSAKPFRNTFLNEK